MYTKQRVSLPVPKTILKLNVIPKHSWYDFIKIRIIFGAALDY